MKIDEKPYRERVAIGTAIEDKMARCMNIHHGWNLQKASFTEDTVDKIDYFEVTTEPHLKVAGKSRDEKSGKDILVCLYEPWFGNIEESDIGRDHLSNYDLFMCLTREQDWIRIAKGRVMKEIIHEAHEEWEIGDCRFPIKVNGKACWKSRKYQGVEFWLHRDNKNRRLKVLGFLPEHIFKKGDLKRYKMFFD